MSDETLTSLPFPYPFVDALLETVCRNMPGQPYIKLSRSTLSSGSCIYTMIAQKKRLGSITLRTTAVNQTVITIHAAELEHRNVLAGLIGNATIAAQITAAADESMISLDAIPPDSEYAKFIEAVKETMQRITTAIEVKTAKPQPNSSVDAWLDWREMQRKKGTKTTLEAIAEESGFSINTLKKQSALRIKRGERHKT